VQHPTYKALAELGKAIKTLFLCRNLHEETLCREIHEDLNVIEQWTQFCRRFDTSIMSLRGCRIPTPAQ
jgi:TnpA family transposase